MLRGQKKEEEEGQVRGSVADELGEGLADEKAILTLGGYQIEDGEERKQEPNENACDELAGPVAPPPAWKVIIPAGCQELLTVWLCYKLSNHRRKKKVEVKLNMAELCMFKLQISFKTAFTLWYFFFFFNRL